MKILNPIGSKIIRLRKPIACVAVLLVVVISLNWLWHMNKVLNEQVEWCDAQKEALPLDVCGGIAERDVEKTYYLKVLMLSVLAFGSIRVFLAIFDKERA